jgi:hypothetical protein
VTGLAPATTFTDAIETLNGKRFLMLRLTFTSDVSVPGGAQPILRSLGVAYEAVNP